MSEIEIREKKWVIKQVKGMTETRDQIQDEF